MASVAATAVEPGLITTAASSGDSVVIPGSTIELFHTVSQIVNNATDPGAQVDVGVPTFGNSSFVVPTASWRTIGPPMTGTGNAPALYGTWGGASAYGGWNSNGEFLGMNAPSTYTGNFFREVVNGGTKAILDYTGILSLSTVQEIGGANYCTFAYTSIYCQNNANDPNPAMEIVKSYAGAAGDILQLANGSAVVAQVHNSGAITAAAGVGPSLSALWTSGSGAPSGSCNSGSLYTNTGGGANTTLYACYSGSWNAVNMMWTTGTVAPPTGTGVCNSGSLYTNQTGGASTTLYVCYGTSWNAVTIP
jgi:hypothetical protein